MAQKSPSRMSWSLTSRIFLTVLMSTILPPLTNMLFFFAVPFQEVRIFSAKWVVERTVQAVRLADQLPNQERREGIGVLPLAPYLVIDIQPKFEGRILRGENPFDGFAIILKNELTRRLGVSANDVSVVSNEPTSSYLLPPLQIRFESVPGGSESLMPSYGALNLEVGDMPIPSIFQIAVKLRDGSWLQIQPALSVSRASQALRLAIVVLGTFALLGSVIYLVSRSLTRPLIALGSAVESFGEGYIADPVPALGIAEYDRIAGKFNQLQVEIATYVRERTQMIGAISHDLRTPLTRLQLFVEYIPDGDIKRNAIASIKDMDLMIEETLSYAQGLMSQEQRLMVDIAVMLTTQVDTQTDLGHYVEYSGPAHVPLLCHPVALKRAFSNLVENGIKYGKAVAISLSASDREVIVSIVDQGMGIPSDKLSAALAPFERLEASRNRKTGGAGLGLTIARDVITRHGGSLSFKQLNGKGFEARVVLPVAKSDAPA
jgi:signal transduction histidine kinase